MAIGSSPARSTTPARRRWRGREPADRIADRRERLVAAGLELMGTQGVRAVSMRGVCRQAGLTERYFYESFSQLDDLLVAVLETVVFQARDALLEALRTTPAERGPLVRHAVQAFTEFLLADPRRGRVMFVESQAAPALAARGNELVAEFTTPIASMFRGGELGRGPSGTAEPDEADIELNALAIFGALAFLYQNWLGPNTTGVAKDRFIEHVAQLIEQIAQTRSGAGGSTSSGRVPNNRLAHPGGS